jgi:hypothetical protein
VFEDQYSVIKPEKEVIGREVRQILLREVFKLPAKVIRDVSKGPGTSGERWRGYFPFGEQRPQNLNGFSWYGMPIISIIRKFNGLAEAPEQTRGITSKE